MLEQAKWICTNAPTGDIVPEYRRAWRAPEGRRVRSATLTITALGVYESFLNGQRVGRFVLAPGWTSYDTRLQVQTYDVTGLLGAENALQVRVGKGWYASPMPGWLESEDKALRKRRKTALIALLRVAYEDGGEECICTDERWSWVESPVRFSEIYDGETFDAAFADEQPKPVVPFNGPRDNLIPQEGEEIREMERVSAKAVFRTPAGETLVDFGQEVTGYVEFTVNAHVGERVRILHGEVLDRDGNFYNENYRSAKAEIDYTCREGLQTWHPELTFFGFRYIKLDQFPVAARPEDFTAVAVYSNIRQTGRVTTGHAGLNRLISNILWGQKGNFLDVPTDCPQRDERLGWTGDAQVFVKAASLNYDVERFFKKWLKDMTADRSTDGSVGSVIPNYLPDDRPSAAWGDAATICPWTIYQTYGGIGVLRAQYDTMTGWVDYITSLDGDDHGWSRHFHYGDWLALDHPDHRPDQCLGGTDVAYISQLYYRNSARAVADAAALLGNTAAAEKYGALADRLTDYLVNEFFAPNGRCCVDTQTGLVLALRNDLSPNPEKCAQRLKEKLDETHGKLQTGFVGTPFLCAALTDHGMEHQAYQLLLNEDYPGWLYAVNLGATTIWERWNSMNPDGSVSSTGMNSFNHYAYGAIFQWLVEYAAGLKPVAPGFRRVSIAPVPNWWLRSMDIPLSTATGK